MLVLALIALLSTLAFPAYQGLLHRWAISREAQTLVEDLRHARAQALLRGQAVSICPSVDGASCATHADWGQGWLIFLDPDANRERSASEAVLHQHRVTPSVGSISSNSGAARAGLTYQPNGQARAAGQALTLRGASNASPARLICVSMQGRASVRPEGQSQCA